jgi:hypothetical protein
VCHIVHRGAREHAIDKLGCVAEQSSDIDVQKRAAFEASLSFNDVHDPAAVEDASSVQSRYPSSGEGELAGFHVAEIAPIETAALGSEVAVVLSGKIAARYMLVP